MITDIYSKDDLRVDCIEGKMYKEMQFGVTVQRDSTTLSLGEMKEVIKAVQEVMPAEEVEE